MVHVSLEENLAGFLAALRKADAANGQAEFQHFFSDAV